MIALTNISKRHGQQALLIDASLELHKGERVGLVGPNGAGKSTIFRMITGEELPDDGEDVKRARAVLLELEDLLLQLVALLAHCSLALLPRVHVGTKV